MQSLRHQIQAEEFDYQMLLDGLRAYAHPRDKITSLLKKGIIVRIKKGLYVFGEEYRRAPVSREILANLIYGPSYISLEYALHYHGLIPERVEALTSVTCGRSRSFSTPLGVFTYHRIPLPAFQRGMDQVLLGDGRPFLIATPEKALADKVVEDRGLAWQTQKACREYLLDNLRVDPVSLGAMNLDRLAEIAQSYRSRKVRTLACFIGNLRNFEGKA